MNMAFFRHNEQPANGLQERNLLRAIDKQTTRESQWRQPEEVCMQLAGACFSRVRSRMGSKM